MRGRSHSRNPGSLFPCRRPRSPWRSSVCGGSLFEVKPDGIVRLTTKGKKTAYRTALRHHLIERMLAEMFGMEWYGVHDERTSGARSVPRF